MARQLERSRRYISKKVRALRLEKGWSQGILAEKLALSQSRLSEIETGDGSFSAEQFLLLLKLFDVTASDFTTEVRDSKLELQQALARFGAIHLYQPEVLPSEQLAEIGEVVREALIDGSPRIVTAVAPILLLRNDLLNLRKLHAQLAELGFERRLPWVIANTLEAIQRKYVGGVEVNDLHRYTAPLELFLEFFNERPIAGGTPPDIIDSSIRTKKTVDEVQRGASALSKQWGIVTTLTPDDFIAALEPVLESR